MSSANSRSSRLEVKVHLIPLSKSLIFAKLLKPEQLQHLYKIIILFTLSYSG